MTSRSRNEPKTVEVGVDAIRRLKTAAESAIHQAELRGELKGLEWTAGDRDHGSWKRLHARIAELKKELTNGE